MRLYVCKDDFTEPTITTDLLGWAKWLSQFDRQVARTLVGRGEVSTVYLGIDGGLLTRREPLLFETMIFTDEPVPCRRYACRSTNVYEARRNHEKCIGILKQELGLPNASRTRKV